MVAWPTDVDRIARAPEAARRRILKAAGQALVQIDERGCRPGPKAGVTDARNRGVPSLQATPQGTDAGRGCPLEG